MGEGGGLVSFLKGMTSSLFPFLILKEKPISFLEKETLTKDCEILSRMKTGSPIFREGQVKYEEKKKKRKA